MNIYVASSWRNTLQPGLVQFLRQQGHTVYDFRNPADGNFGFAWSRIDPEWLQWDGQEFQAALQHPVAREGFRLDMEALKACDVCVLVLPCGRSAHLELGWAAGAGKATAVLLLEPCEPELMYGMLGAVCTGLAELVAFLDRLVLNRAGVGTSDDCTDDGGEGPPRVPTHEQVAGPPCRHCGFTLGAHIDGACPNQIGGTRYSAPLTDLELGR